MTDEQEQPGDVGGPMKPKGVKVVHPNPADGERAHFERQIVKRR